MPRRAPTTAPSTRWRARTRTRSTIRTSPTRSSRRPVRRFAAPRRRALQNLPLRRLSLQEECLWKRTFATDLERPEVFVPGTGRRLGLGFTPQLELVEVLGGYLAIGDPIKQMLAETRWKIGPPNLRHQPPNVIRASSSFTRSRSAASEDSVRRLTSKKNRSFSASLDCRPASIKSTSTRLALVFRVLANVRTRLAIPAGIETL